MGGTMSDYKYKAFISYRHLEPDMQAAEKLQKLLESYKKALEECEQYDLRLHEVAQKFIAFDLDDGVKVNYAKFGDVLANI